MFDLISFIHEKDAGQIEVFKKKKSLKQISLYTLQSFVLFLSAIL